MNKKKGKIPIQPVSGTKVPRFAGASTFARLPELRDVSSCDVAIVGVQFVICSLRSISIFKQSFN